MKKVQIKLENCYGIKGLKYKFDFSNKNAVAIYAPNGLMKSSLAQTFDDVANNLPSKDRIFPDRETIRDILDENGDVLKKDTVFVIRPYNEVFSHTEKPQLYS